MNAIEYAAQLVEYTNGDFEAARRVLANSKAHFKRMTQDYADNTLYNIDVLEELAWLD